MSAVYDAAWSWSDGTATVWPSAEPRVSGREALRVHHLIDAVLRASAEGQTVAVPSDQLHAAS